MNTYFISTNELNEQMIVSVIENQISFIPKDELNYDYQQYLLWLEEGNTPEEWNPETGEVI